MRKRKIAKVKNSIFSAIFFSKIFLPFPSIDDDECALSRHNCFDPYECHNTKGDSFNGGRLTLYLKHFNFIFLGSFRCVRKARITTTTFTTTTTTTRRPEFYPRFTTPSYNPYQGQDGQMPCTPGLERNSFGACVGESFFHS